MQRKKAVEIVGYSRQRAKTVGYMIWDAIYHKYTPFKFQITGNQRFYSPQKTFDIIPDS